MSNICVPEVIDPSGSETESNPSYDSAYTDDDDLDAPLRPRTKSYHSPRQIQAQGGLHRIPTSTAPRPSDGKGSPDSSDVMKEKEEIPVSEVKTWVKPRRERVGEKVVMTEDEGDGGCKKWKERKQDSKMGKKRRFGGGGGDGSSATDAFIKKRKLITDNISRPLATKRPSSRAVQGITVGRRPVAGELLRPAMPLAEPWGC